MATIVGISGSLRKGSYNSALLRAAATIVPAGSLLEIRSIADIALYNGDVEADAGIPAAVAALKDAVASANALLIVTPEYNNGIPGVLKNVIDWMSRPTTDIARVFGGRIVGVIGASPGGFGTTLAQNAWLPVLRTLGTELWTGGRLMVSRANTVFDGDGALTDEQTRESLRQYMTGLCGYADRAKQR